MANITTSTTISTSVEVSAVLVQNALELAQLRETQRDLAKKEAMLKERLLNALGEAEEATFGGVVVYKTQTSTRRSNDLKALAEKFPEAYAETLRETPVVKIITL
jgi:low affinity Fe/Cu permease